MTHPIHPTAEEIFNGLKSENPVISQATVYNTLNLYEFNKKIHGHFIC